VRRVGVVGSLLLDVIVLFFGFALRLLLSCCIFFFRRDGSRPASAWRTRSASGRSMDRKTISDQRDHKAVN